jgi:cytochrome c
MSLRRIAAASLAVAALATVAAPSVNAATAKKTTTTSTKTTTTKTTLAGPAAAGKKVFDTQCVICHSVAPGEGGTVGPELNGVVGRKIATAPGFAYSKAMKAKSNMWTTGNLDIYLTDPQKFVPGTAMPINVPAAADRTAVIAYLATTK